MATIRWPSLAGVGAATQVLDWQSVRPVAQNWRSQSFDPSVALKQMTCSRCCFRPLQQVTNTRSPMIIGLESPLPGNSAFQARSLLVSSVIGTPDSSETPLHKGPRNCGQSAAGNGPPVRRSNAANRTMRTLRAGCGALVGWYFMVVRCSRKCWARSWLKKQVCRASR